MKIKGKTIKRLADEIGVSKTTIRKKMDERFRSLYVFKDEKGVIYINFDGEIELKKAFNALGRTANQVETPETKFSETTANSGKGVAKTGANSEKQFSETTANQVETTANQVETTANQEVLLQMIDMLQGELDAKNNQLEHLQKLLDQEQQLHARAQEKLFLLEAKEETAVTQETGKRTLWNRLFGK